MLRYTIEIVTGTTTLTLGPYFRDDPLDDTVVKKRIRIALFAMGVNKNRFLLSKIHSVTIYATDGIHAEVVVPYTEDVWPEEFCD